MRRFLIDTPLGVGVRRLGATLHCRSGAESLLAPDAAVISHPKTGRTWLRVMLADAGVRRICFSHAGSGEQASLTIDRLQRIVSSWHGKRILFLVRDPRDTVTSFYFQATRRSRVYSGTFADFLRDPRFGLERAIRFNLLWLGRREHFSSFRLLSYEQLHRDSQGELARAARFLSKREVDELDVMRAAVRSSFKALHALEASGEGRKRWGFRLSPGDSRDPESFKTRRGLVGGWRDYFSSEDEAYAEGLLSRYDYFGRLSVCQYGTESLPGLADAA